ncbi:anti-sigma factor [Paenibacillus arenilitoris]|uniref:Anti-sigma factor n=1 Tax=Paenibacillus arenilitoris TaxID=2772299 RepID=A0A927CJ82_9BACL|nr:anti-sigma factor [Paenibacillus arenilitoris]MBD2867623.1 anti-sigma factor [Paenibacillus arenilitoris]
MSGTKSSDLICKRMYREEEWIDWLLGNKMPDEAESMRLHAAGCAKCRYAAGEWKPLLATEQQADGKSDGAALLPSPSVRRKLRSKVKMKGWLARAARGMASGKGRIAAASGIAILLCAVMLQSVPDEPDAKHSRYVEAYEPRALSFMNDPRTAGFPVHALRSELGAGYVWFNEGSGEVLLLLEGMLPSDGFVIQAWLLEGSTHRNMGVLKHLEASRAHLYFKDKAIARPQNIALTVEPHGGSLEPTSPDALVIRLQRP